jgi:hypothetical protein
MGRWADGPFGNDEGLDAVYRCEKAAILAEAGRLDAEVAEHVMRMNPPTYDDPGAIYWPVEVLAEANCLEPSIRGALSANLQLFGY